VVKKSSSLWLLQLTPWSGVLEKPTINYVVRNFPSLMESLGSLSFSQGPSSDSYSEPDECSPHPLSIFFNVYFNIKLYLYIILKLPEGLRET